MWAVLCLGVVEPGWAMPRFGRTGTYAVDGSPVGVRAGAIDSQAGLDLVTANQAGEEGPSLSLLFNRGLGSFSAEERMSLSAANYILHAVAAGDFTGDGQDDLALAVDDISVFPIRAEVLVLRNTGNGQFATPAEYRLPGLFPRCIEAVDVTGDGVLDLAVCHARNVNDMAEGQVTVLAGQATAGVANGAFAQVFTGAVGAAPSALSAGDVDADGHADLVVVDPDGSAVYLLYGTGTPAVFGAPIKLGNIGNPVAAVIDDVPGLSFPEVLVSTQPQNLMTFRQSSARNFAAPTSMPVGLLPTAIALGPIDTDAIADLVVLSALGAEVWYGQSDGGFAFGESISTDDSLTALTLADLNGDGSLDVAASAINQDHVVVALNGADVPFTPSPTPTITPTPTRTMTGTRTGTPGPTGTGGTPTPTRSVSGTPAPGACPGDCNADDAVVVNELILGVNIALGNTTVSSCPAFDRDGSDSVAVNELIAAVNAALNGCPAS